MKFFKPEDFSEVNGFSMDEQIAKLANAKLIKEGIVVYGKHNSWGEYGFHTNKDLKFLDGSLSDKKALLINIEPIEKCRHLNVQPRIIIKDFKQYQKLEGYHLVLETNTDCEFLCECGAKVKPTAFEEVK